MTSASGAAPLAWRLAVLLTTVVTIAVNALANALPIAGRTTGEVSALLPTPITPAGYVFSIWIVIYLLLVGYAVWQALPAQRRHEPSRRAAPAVVLANVANAAWIVAWHRLWIGTSLLLMLVLLAALVAAYRTLRAGGGGSEASPGLAERVWTRGTFSVYLGWITIAAFANLGAYATALGWDGGFLPLGVWGAVAIAVATALGVRQLLVERDLAYSAVLAWAFVGIVVARIDATVVAGTAVVGVLALAYAAADVGRRRGYTALR